MKRITINLLLIGLITLTHCSLQTKDQGASIETDSLTIQAASIQQTEKDYNLDTLSVGGKVVVFFTISQKEYDLLPDDPNSGVDEVLDDFNYYAGLASDSIKTMGYETMITGSRYIRIKMNDQTFKTFDRLERHESIVGYIFSNGIKEPTIEYGVGTDMDILKSFSDFNEK